jgi:hypothetical protein
MASKRQHEKNIIDIIHSHNDILCVSDIFVHYVDIGRSRFYQLGLDKLDTIREAINANKVKAKHYMRKKWIKSDNPTLQITAYRLIADDDELLRLNSRNVDMKVNGNIEVPITTQLPKLSEEDIEELRKMNGLQ